MKIKNFPEANIRLGRSQPQYQTLHAHKKPDGEVIYCFEPTDEELEEISKTREIWFRQLTFNLPFQPVLAMSEKPDMQKEDQVKVEIQQDKSKEESRNTVSQAIRFNNNMSLYLDSLKNRDPLIRDKWTIEEFAKVQKMPVNVAHDMMIVFSMFGLTEVFQGANGTQFYKITLMDRVHRLKENNKYYKEKILEWETKLYKSNAIIKHLEG